tara:strand:+ start:27 stop:416 length:390 start_codon:yes stop_codon:yes gene_type:complete
MKNFRNNRRRFRSNSFDRSLKINSKEQNLRSGFGNISDFKKKNYSRNNFNSSKLIQKYMDFAREALSSGDKILYENYLQHAEHFIRVTDNISNTTNLKDKSNSNLNEINLNKISEDDFKQEDSLKVEKS